MTKISVDEVESFGVDEVLTHPATGVTVHLHCKPNPNTEDILAVHNDIEGWYREVLSKLPPSHPEHLRLLKMVGRLDA